MSMSTYLNYIAVRMGFGVPEGFSVETDSKGEPRINGFTLAFAYALGICDYDDYVDWIRTVQNLKLDTAYSYNSIEECGAALAFTMNCHVFVYDAADPESRTLVGPETADRAVYLLQIDAGRYVVLKVQETDCEEEESLAFMFRNALSMVESACSPQSRREFGRGRLTQPCIRGGSAEAESTGSVYI